MNRKIWVNFLALIIILVQLVPKFDAENVDQQVQNSEHVTARLTTGEIRGRVSYLAGKHKPAHVFQVDFLKFYSPYALLFIFLCYFRVYLLQNLQ